MGTYVHRYICIKRGGGETVHELTAQSRIHAHRSSRERSYATWNDREEEVFKTMRDEG